jgi:hypothetical protein
MRTSAGLRVVGGEAGADTARTSDGSGSRAEAGAVAGGSCRVAYKLHGGHAQ